MYVKYLKLTIDCSRFTLDWYLHEFISLRLITDLLILKVVLIHVMWPLGFLAGFVINSNTNYHELGSGVQK